ncbi:uncharacterized protein AB675_2168 [Cyphellophora attinorum]|uniref:NDT80 domain-containing protein n=1 Tax=Cyphellophora attinorum TaxID=1664694 RepID=A0A0N1HY25_9EURO|nr:uncharacterized protein AB675_2168 [Phialophora attinorum]KPI43116.1 hypothetical protein AB675_2168 [Phialophora attinorum]
MRTPTSPYRGSYYANDNTYSDGVNMPQSESSDVKGPGFSETVPLAELVNRSGTHMKPEIIASIHKGFFQVDNKWTCYRRNYFQVNCGFTFKSHQDSHVYLRQNDQHQQVYGYAVSIRAKTGPSGSTEGEARGLVQHTPKRQKQQETVPTKHAVVPQTALHQNPHQHHGHMYQHPPGAVDPYYAHGHAFGNFGSRGIGFDSAAQTPASYTFERIQFQKATANNGKRRAQQQFFHVIVELSVNISPPNSHRDDWVVVATRESEPMVVRGRSPGHYKDNHHRRDSHGHMDHDRAAGGAGDRGQMPYNPYSSAPVGSYESSHSGHHSGYSGTSYQQTYLAHASPPSAGSGTRLNGSPEEAGFAISDNETLRSTDVYSQQLTPPSETEDETMFALGRKRPHEDDNPDEASAYRFSPTLCDSMSAHTMDYPTFARSKALVASS